jgi:hypothetical protein
MTITETLFGGLFAVALLFMMARRVGLSYYWSAILGGALPFLAYLGWSMATTGLGGDVLAIHLVVYMAGAAVLGVFGNMQSKKEPMHWAPKLLIAFFVVLTLFMAAFVSIATNGLPDSVAQLIMPNAHNQATHTRFPGAVPHDRNHLYEPHLQRLEQQRNLGWQVELKGFDGVKENIPAQVQIVANDNQGSPIEGATVTLDLWRMANSADDRKVEMAATGAGTYGAELKLGDAGNWIVEIYVERGQDSYLVQQPLTVAE